MFESLRSLSDRQLLTNTDAIIVQDRKLTVRLLEHLHEIERRRLYLELACSSMFDYCTRHLRLSAPAAARRIRTARCLARFPRLHDLLESGEINLTTASMVAKLLKPENADVIIGRIKGRSKREVERIVAEYEPHALVPRDRVRPVVISIAKAAQSDAATVAGDSEKAPRMAGSLNKRDMPACSTAPRETPRAPGDVVIEHETPGATEIAVAPHEAMSVTEIAVAPHEAMGVIEIAVAPHEAASVSASAVTPHEFPSAVETAAHSGETLQFERRLRIEFTVHEALMVKLERIRSIVSHRLPANASLEHLMEFMADYVIHREDPTAREQRRETRAAKQPVIEERAHAGDSRQLPARVRDQVFVRDRRCTYVSTDGNQCGSTHVLQVDHIKPVARGGASTIDNLRLLCAYHNRLEAERLMGDRRPLL